MRGGVHCGWAGCLDCDDDHELDLDLDDDSSFAYTVGLFGMGHPELLIHGISPRNAMSLLNEVGDLARGGAHFVPGSTIAVGGGRNLLVEAVPNAGHIVFTANRYYQRSDEASVPVLQLACADQFGYFPWDEGYSLPGWVQPRPGTFTV